MKPFPKDVLGYVYDPRRTFFHITVVLDNQPGAVKEVAERLAATKLNVLQGFHSAPPGNPQGVWSLFVESKDSRLTTDQVAKAVDSSRYVLDCEVRKSTDGFLIDDFHFPVRIAPNHEAILLSPKATRSMLESIAQTYGSGGETIVYNVGMEVGKVGSGISRDLVGDAVVALAPRLIKIFDTSGLGQAEQTEFELSPFRTRIRIVGYFECVGKKASSPLCHFMRGVIAGGTIAGLGLKASCKEEVHSGRGPILRVRRGTSLALRRDRICWQEHLQAEHGRRKSVFCPNCGKQIADNSTACTFCGRDLKKTTPSQGLMLLTSNYAPGYQVDKVLGLVYGITVRSRGIGGNILAGLRSIGGGEINEYTEMAHQARQQALDRLAEHAKSMGANGVISVMFDSTEIGTTMDEIIAFGTAVVISPVKGTQEFVKLS